ncbi:hypothetical protein [Permianibacter aggregans]|uniref:hypothetical protein n=1 Tax=Permianibacter aggregans TaxID=1510150 RepID=UPI0013C36BA6|nr:hypothetical protein [Permianibacter aggregans]
MALTITPDLSRCLAIGVIFGDILATRPRMLTVALAPGYGNARRQRKNLTSGENFGIFRALPKLEPEFFLFQE